MNGPRVPGKPSLLLARERFAGAKISRPGPDFRVAPGAILGCVEAAGVLKSRGLVLALGVGALPALLAWRLGDGFLTTYDLLSALAVAPLALLLARIVPALPVQRGGSPLWLALAVAALVAGAGHLRLPTTVTNDERAVLFQAELFAGGQLDQPLGHRAYQDPVAHCPTHRRQVYEDPARGVRYSKYPPGASLFLAPFTAAGSPAAGSLFAGLLSVVLVLRLARRFGLSVPAWAPVLLATTPFFLLVQGSFQSEVYTLPAALLGFLFLLRLRDRDGRPWANGLGLGAAAGWIFLCRPLTGVVFALACLPGLLRRGPGHPAPGPRATAFAVLGGLPFLACALLYNHLQTGDWLLSPYQAYARDFGPFFAPGSPRAGQPMDVYGNGDLLTGLLRQGGRWSVALFGCLGAAAFGFWGLWRSRRRDGGSAVAFAVLLPLAYSLHWYPGHWAYHGPLYLYETLGLLLIGALALLDDAPPRWRRALPLAAVIAGPVLFLWRFQLVEDQANLRARPQLAAAEAPPGSVILYSRPLVPSPPPDEDPGKLYTPSLPPFADGQTVFLRELRTPQKTLEALRELGLAGRPVFRFLPGDLAEFDRLQPYTP